MDPYSFVKKLGTGTMGEVWLTHHNKLMKHFVLKILSKEVGKDSSNIKRLEREIRKTAELDHPAIITPDDIGKRGHVYYIISAYVDGETLAAKLARDGTIPEKEALRIVRHVAEALQYAWDNFSLAHGNIKPGNIILTSVDEVKIINMCISTDFDQVKETACHKLDTPHYLSPEQALTQASPDSRSDIYSLGATLYHCLTGVTPHRAETTGGVLEKHIKNPLPAPDEINPGISAATSALVEIMMAKERDVRYSSWSSLLAELKNVRRGIMPKKAKAKDKKTKTVVMRRSAAPAKVGTTPPSRNKGRTSNVTSAKHARSSLKPVWIACSLLAVVICVAAVFLFSGNAPPRSVQSSRDSSPEARQTVENNGVSAWQYAVTYARENPKNLQQAIRNFELVQTRFSDTRYKNMAVAEIKRLRHLADTNRRKAIDDIMSRLRQQAKPALDENDLDAAANIYSSYSGKQAKETLTQREAKAAEYRQRAVDLKQTRKAAVISLREKTNVMLNEVAVALIDDNLAGALYTCIKSLSDTSLTVNKETVHQLSDLLNELAAVDKRIIDGFRKNIGESITLILEKKRCKLKVMDAKDGVLRVRTQPGKLGGVTRSLTAKQLTINERCKRAKGILDPQTYTLYMALLAYKTGRQKAAMERFAKVDILSMHLLAEMRRRQQNQSETDAERAFNNLIWSVGLSINNLSKKTVLEKLGTRSSLSGSRTFTKRIQAYRLDYGETIFGKDKSAILKDIEIWLSESLAKREWNDAAKDLPEKNQKKDKFMRRVEEARAQRGHVIECSPAGAGNSIKPDDLQAVLKPGMVVHFQSGTYPTNEVFFSTDDIVIEGEKDIRDLNITVLEGKNIVIRNIFASNVVLGRSGGKTKNAVIVDCRLKGLFLSAKCDFIVHNCLLNFIIVWRTSSLQVRNCTIINTSTSFSIYSTLDFSRLVQSVSFRDCVIYAESAAIRIEPGMKDDLGFDHCIVFGRKLFGFSAFAKPEFDPNSDINEKFRTFKEMKKWVETSYCIEKEPVFRNILTGDLRLISVSNERRDVINIQNIGANLTKSGFPFPRDND